MKFVFKYLSMLLQAFSILPQHIKLEEEIITFIGG